MIRKGFLAGLVLSLVAVFGVLDSSSASAAPGGGLYVAEERCEANGTVSALLAWSPSGTRFPGRLNPASDRICVSC